MLFLLRVLFLCSKTFLAGASVDAILRVLFLFLSQFHLLHFITTDVHFISTV